MRSGPWIITILGHGSKMLSANIELPYHDTTITRKKGLNKNVYLHFKFDHILWPNIAIMLNDRRFIAKIVIVVHRIIKCSFTMTRTAGNPSAFHVVVPNLFPVNVQFLQSFENFCHYLTWMGSRLTIKPD